VPPLQEAEALRRGVEMKIGNFGILELSIILAIVILLFGGG